MSDSEYTKRDAKAVGALCDQCAFSHGARAAGMVGPELHRNASVLLVGEAPSADEVKVGRPFVGQSGQELFKSLRSLSIKREHVSIFNACACRPAGNKMDKVRGALKIINAERAKLDKSSILHPIDACRPRLLNELADYENIVTLGGVAYQGITGSRASIMNIRGAPVDWNGHPDGRVRKLLPTLHPAFVLRQLRWRHVLHKDLARAFRWFRGDYGWVEPNIRIGPSYDEIVAFLARPEPFFSCDFETDGIKPLTAQVRCFGISTASGNEVIVIPFLSIDGITRYYSQFDEARILDALRSFLANPNKRKVGHNFGWYDALVAKGQWGVQRVNNMLDTILLHRSAESEMPHNLAYVGSVYTDIASAWKSEHTAVAAKTDQELHIYNAYDCAVGARIVKPLVAVVKEKRQSHIVSIDHKIQEVCVGMHEVGMLVDFRARDVWDRKLLLDAVKYRKDCQDVVENAKFNPASVLQIRDLLYDNWQLPIVKRVDDKDESSDPSTDDETLLKLLLEPGLTAQQKRFLSSLRMFRRRAKLRGTYIVKLRKKGEIYSLDDLSIDEDDLFDDAKDFTKKDVKKEGILDADGRLRTGWNAHGTNTGRLSCGRPMNLQNVPIKLRNIFIPQPGCVYVYADMDQLELRLITAFSNAKLYGEVFKNGGDPHSASTLMVFGDSCRVMYDAAVAKYGSDKAARKKDPDWARLCDFGKKIVYASSYMADVDTVHRLIRSAEDDNEQLVYADLTIEKTQMAHRSWLSQNPEIERWWKDVVDEYRSQGFLLGALHGRRCDFADGENQNQIVNFKCQCSGAEIVNDGTFEFTEKVQPHKYGRNTGLVNQTHDALMSEVPERLAEKCKTFLENCLHRQIPGYDMDFTASSKIMKNWAGA